mmetsp:Transcript_26680/g.30676  ORF Transcript_26680/g.30676 Transcript_26680/m.30676 type:complete len:331 (+) Transcript_26680:884-1876(+)
MEVDSLFLTDQPVVINQHDDLNALQRTTSQEFQREQSLQKQSQSSYQNGPQLQQEEFQKYKQQQYLHQQQQQHQSFGKDLKAQNSMVVTCYLMSICYELVNELGEAFPSACRNLAQRFVKQEHQGQSREHDSQHSVISDQNHSNLEVQTTAMKQEQVFATSTPSGIAQKEHFYQQQLQQEVQEMQKQKEQLQYQQKHQGRERYRKGCQFLSSVTQLLDLTQMELSAWSILISQCDFRDSDFSIEQQLLFLAIEAKKILGSDYFQILDRASSEVPLEILNKFRTLSTRMESVYSQLISPITLNQQLQCLKERSQTLMKARNRSMRDPMRNA